MDKSMMGYILRKENGGINGLTIKTRRPQDRTIKPVAVEAPKAEGDLRNFTNSGVIQPLEDYWISGEGRTPIGIREVQTTIPGMKKYALLNPPDQPDKKKTIFRSRKKREKEAQKPVVYDVSYVYSEGIDFKKMIEDEDYAKAVITLLQEERLQKKERESYQLGSDTVYIGTIAKIDGKYVKAGVKEYSKAIIGIDSQLQKQQQAVRLEHESILEAQRARRKNQERKNMTQKLSRDEWKEYLGDLLSAYDMPEATTMLREVWEEKIAEQQTCSGKNSDEQEFLEW